MLRIEIYSDPVCPWCYVGNERLNAAIKCAEHLHIQLSWKPFQLNPDMPSYGIDRSEYLRNKFGGDQGARSAYSPLLRAVEEDGIELNLDKIRVMPNSLDAHRIIRWAEIEGDNSSLVADALFRAFFVDGLDIGDRVVLTEISAKCGMDPVLVGKLLNSETDVGFVNASDRKARTDGIHGVPYFIVDRQLAISGAQPESVWMTVFGQFDST